MMVYENISTIILETILSLNSSNSSNSTFNNENYFNFSYTWWQKVIFAGFMIPVIVFSVIGNIFVILAIVKNTQLQITGNIFLASLAVADSAIGCFAMPLNALQLLTGKWYFGPVVCRLWFTCDVLFSTASILHLFCISVDRFLSITNCFAYFYKGEEPTKSWRIRIMIGSVWLVSALLSFIPIFTDLFTTKEHAQEIDRLKFESGICEFKVNFEYRIVSSLISFWLPGIGMVVFYCLLMRKAMHFAAKDNLLLRARGKSVDNTTESLLIDQQNNNNNNYRRQTSAGLVENIKSEQYSRRKISLGGAKIEKWNREYRALKTFGTIMGVFCICWFFFFLNYTICNDEILPCEKYIGKHYYIIIVDILFWIGYFNSMVNPFLYNFTNQDFQKAFRSLLGIRSNDETNLFRKICCFCSRKNKKDSFSSTNYNYHKKRSSSLISGPGSN